MKGGLKQTNFAKSDNIFCKNDFLFFILKFNSVHLTGDVGKAFAQTRRAYLSKLLHLFQSFHLSKIMEMLFFGNNCLNHYSLFHLKIDQAIIIISFHVPFSSL